MSSCSDGGVDVGLAAAQRDGRNAAGGHPIGIEPAVGDRTAPACPPPPARPLRPPARTVRRRQAEGFVIEPAVERTLPAAAGRVVNAGGGLLERGVNGRDDFGAELGIVAAGFGPQVDRSVTTLVASPP